MKTQDFYYELPQELIAQEPLKTRSDSRLMVLDKVNGEIKHKNFNDITDYLNEGDLLVLNDTKVIPARLYGRKKDTGGAIEFLLLKRISKDEWEVILKPGKKAKPGAEFVFSDELSAKIISIQEGGTRIVKFEYEGIFEEVLDKLGEMPLPPYITHKLEDKNRYQTVYAKNSGSAAAPTAGLHFTKEVLEKIKNKGVNIEYVTLHVGLGTFRPVKVENVDEHIMHSEYYEISKETIDAINQTKQNNKRVIAVGTTATRVLETAYKDGIQTKEQKGYTNIFIYPGKKINVVDALLTNFHLPESTLIMLVSALAGKENVLFAYNEAVKEKYRFFSFGDAMFIQ